MHGWLILFLLFSNLFALYTPPLVPSAAEVSNVGIFYEYGEKVVFQARVSPVENIDRLYLFIQPDGQSTRIEPVSFDDDGQATLEYDARQFPLRPFARTEYWFRMALTSGEEIESQHYSFDYIDNRYTWKTLSDDHFQVNWYEGELDFGQQVLNVGQVGWQSALNYVPAAGSGPVKVFVYATAADLQQALQLSQQSWVAGHASPDLGVILISVAPGAEQQLELERQIPHELVHLMQYQIVGESYGSVPVWMLEGMASLAELYPNPDYERVLEKAAASDSLLPVNTLCKAFPREASGAFLAYAESASFVRYLHSNYGASGLESLLVNYKDGLGCEQGLTAAFGDSLDQLEYRWRMESLKMNVFGLAVQNLSPYLLILVVLLAAPLATLLYTRITRV